MLSSYCELRVRVRVVSTYQVRKHAPKVRKSERKVREGEGRGTHGVKPRVWENHQQVQHEQDNTTLNIHKGEMLQQPGTDQDGWLALQGPRQPQQCA
jgi:hypothetical protein